MENYSIADLDITPFISLPAYGRSSFARIFRPFIDLSGEPCPIGPSPDNKPRFSFKSLKQKNRREEI